MRYAVGCDHAGLPLKEPLLAELRAQGVEALDMGTDGPESVDYPLFAQAVARAVQSGEADGGLLLCGTGVGMAVAANKYQGIRAASLSETFSARMARAHNDANVLCLGGRVLGPGAAVDILRVWLESIYEGGRHDRRLEMITEAERQ
jgi:ribose 5-phosphate isomerase B